MRALPTPIRTGWSPAWRLTLAPLARMPDRRRLWSLLVDPDDGTSLTMVNGGEPALVSSTGRRHPIVRDIPRFVPETGLDPDQASTRDTFSRKWDRVASFG